MAILRNLDREHGRHNRPPECKVIDGNVVKFSDMVVHRFRIGDVDDPVLYAAEPIWEWQQTEAGKFVMENAIESPWWVRHVDHLWYGFEFVIVARMKESDQTFYTLKYVNTNNLIHRRTRRGSSSSGKKTDMERYRICSFESL